MATGVENTVDAGVETAVAAGLGGAVATGLEASVAAGDGSTNAPRCAVNLICMHAVHDMQVHASQYALCFICSWKNTLI